MKTVAKVNIKPTVTSRQEVLKIRTSVREANDAVRKSLRNTLSKESLSSRLLQNRELSELMTY